MKKPILSSCHRYEYTTSLLNSLHIRLNQKLIFFKYSKPQSLFYFDHFELNLPELPEGVITSSNGIVHLLFTYVNHGRLYPKIIATDALYR